MMGQDRQLNRPTMWTCPTGISQVSLWFLAVSMGGCQLAGEVEPTGGEAPELTDPQPIDDTAPVFDTGWGDTGWTVDTDTNETLPVIDCAAPIPTGDLPLTIIPGASGYHGLAFDELGYIYGSDGNSIVKATYGGVGELFAPNVGETQQMERMPDGDYAVAFGGWGGPHGLVRLYQNGGTELMVPDIDAYGVRMGPDGMIYTADQDVVHRIDPATNVATVLIESMGGFTPKVLDFSPDFSKMYIGTISGSAKVFVVELDAMLNPLTEPVLFVSNVGNGWHDSLTVDICGNLYVADFNALAMYRVSPEGYVEQIHKATWQNGMYGHGAVFGSGIGGWREDAIYVPQPYNGNTVGEIVVELPYRTWDKGTVINGP